MTTSKKLLYLSLVCLAAGLAFATGIINVQAIVALYVVLPLGAIFLGLFMIFRMLEKEVSQYDADLEAASKVIAPKLPEPQLAPAHARATKTQPAH